LYNRLSFVKKIFILLLLLLHAFGSQASVPLILKDQKEDYYLDFDKVDILEDKSGAWDIAYVSSPMMTDRFQPGKSRFVVNDNTSSTYWIRFTIHDNSDASFNWLLESFNFNIKTLDFYIPTRYGKYQVQTNGNLFPFDHRLFKHKNFEFPLAADHRGPTTYYLKYKNDHAGRVILVVRAFTRFTSYSLTEYFMLGIFYGMVLVIGVYNLFLFFTIKDIAYLYYVCYVFSFGFFSMCQDGIGFQYIWPDHPAWNNYVIPTWQWLMVIFLLMYSKTFLNVKEEMPLLNRIINIFIVCRTIFFILSITIWPYSGGIHYIDLIPFLLAYVSAIISYSRGYSAARYFVMGFTILFIAFLINNLRLLRIISPNVIATYSLNIGAIFEMILLSLALADRIKSIRESDMLKERVNRELEKKVKERTDAFLQQKNVIQEKVQEHDNFIYKVSHDIKGPLKSIIGLTDVGMKDKAENSHEYFQHIMKSAKRLDNIVMDLLFITKVNRAKVDITEIDFKNTIEEIKGSFEHLPNYKGMRFEFDIEQKEKFYCENFILYSIFQNLIENAIKYRKTSHNDSFLKIKILTDGREAKIKFEDNGIGMSSEYHNKIFDMFFRIHSGKDSTGLGLYIVKVSVEKLGGTIRIESKPEQGTTFYITLTNFLHGNRNPESEAFAQARQLNS
jgi:two-component system, sensor histidine kinase LadS